jgi:hypothetical protein
LISVLGASYILAQDNGGRTPPCPIAGSAGTIVSSPRILA